MKKTILLTNDDGIHSPALWETAKILQEIADVTIVAPREQQSGTGRSMPKTSLCTIEKVNSPDGSGIKAYAIDATPAQAVQYGVLEIMETYPDLIVSGINYGNNFSHSVTASGTLGATLEAAAIGIPSVALSLETDFHEFYNNSNKINFKNAALVTKRVISYVFEHGLPDECDILKVEMPRDVEKDTPAFFVPLSPKRFYQIGKPERTKKQWQEPFHYLKISQAIPATQHPKNSDVYVTLVDRLVALSPIRFNMSAPIDFQTVNKNKV